jgi:SAM-dependent methyltransferase
VDFKLNQPLPPSHGEAPFDRYASNYDRELNRVLALTGESLDYFAEMRIRFTVALLRQLKLLLPARPAILDFGCGVGTAIPILQRYLPDALVSGCDISSESLGVAREKTPYAALMLPHELPLDFFDLVFTNGVFHHIPSALRHDALRQIFDSMKTEGVLVFWENNGWNPSTRLIMARTVLDADATVFSPSGGSRLIGSKFQIRARRSYFYFPSLLKGLRPIEKILSHLPLGGQFLGIGQKPVSEFDEGDAALKF